MIKDTSGDDFIIDYNPSIKESDAFHLDYMGDLNTLTKQYSALDKTKKGLSTNPNLGLILNIKENSDSDNDTADTMDEVLKEILSSYQTRALGLTKRVRKKIFKNKPTENQEKAIEIALNTPDIAIIQGPPGTGKTTVINAICERLFEEYPKDKNINGQILLCAQGNDATNNARERIKVGGLPTFKFGAKKNAKEEQYKQDERLNERLREFAEILIESVRKKLQSLGDYENIEKILDLEEALRRYHSSPISELEFLKEIEKNAIFFNSSMRERLSRLKAKQQKQEMPANLSIIHVLRATQEGFEDDGVMRNYDLLESQFKENLTKEDRELLKSPKPNLEKLQELKIRLLEKNAPKRKYEIPKPNEEVVSLANDLLEILSSQSPNDKRIRVLLEYLSVLERTPWDLESLLRDYNFVFSSTIGQHNKALERKETPYFDSVIVDETAKANPLELLMVMELAKECIILVGDDRQLPHYLDDEIGKKLEDESQDAQDEIEKALKDSMFKKLKERAQKLKELDGKECFITLNKQYRLAKKQEDNIYTNANGAKGEINKKGYLANALKDYDETLVEAFMRDFKERYKIEKLYYLLDDKIKNFEFAKIKHKISLYFKDAKFYPKSVALGLSSLFENKLEKNERLCYNGVDLVVKENHKSKTFNDCGLVLERQKSDDSKEALILQDSFIKKALKNLKEP